MSNLIIGGNHRGAKAIGKELRDETVRLYEPEWVLADPKPDRAVQMAGFLKDRFPALRPQPLTMPVQGALAYSGEHDTVVLALDTVSDTAESLAARRSSQRALFQFAGRGQGGSEGTHLAIRGTIYPDDHDTESAALLLLQTLAPMSQATSSRDLTGPDPLTAAVLQPLRSAASHQTAQHLAEIEREPWDLSGGALSVCFGQTSFPLYPVQGQPQDTHSQWKDRALDTVSGLPANHFLSRGLRGGFAYVAVVIPDERAIHFLKVAQNRTGKRSIAGVTTFQAPRVRASLSLDAAVFTD